MSNYPPITVAIPTYRRCESVASLAKSIIAQLEDEDELLVVDDGSQDGTSEILKQMTRVRLISNTSNQGMVNTWNQCLTSATHDWICIIHDDDTIAPNALKTIRKACTLLPEPSLIGHNYLSDNFDDSFQCRIVEPGSWSALHPLVIPSGVTIHRSMIDAIGLFDERFKYSADIEYLSRICSKYTSIIIENPQIISFNLHEENYEYRTWIKPDFLTQLEQIEECLINYSGLSGDKASNYFRDKMNQYVSYMLKTSYRAKDKTILRKIGLMARNKSYLTKKNYVATHFASFLNWVPSTLI